MALVAFAGITLTGVAAERLASDRAQVYLVPKQTVFWQTATGNQLTVPVWFPRGVTSAELTVEGSFGYRRVYAIESEGDFALTLPEATNAQTEDVFDLTLRFSDGTERTARLGLIAGLRTDAAGATRCLLPQGARKWNGVVGHAVLPIPYGMTSFTIDGQAVDTGLDGAQGWYALDGMDVGVEKELRLRVDEYEYGADLLGKGAGFTLLLR